MYLEKFSYYEYLNTPKKWILEEFILNDINLMVGNNASGKSRTLNVISGLSKLILSPRITFDDGYFSASFSIDKSTYSYKIKIQKGMIENEILKIDDKDFIVRNIDGKGKIFSVVSKTMIDFKIPTNELIASRRDEAQYPYLNNLYDWAFRLRHFRFAKEQEKQTLTVVDINRPISEPFNLKETDKVIQIFKLAKKEFNNNFIKQVIDDFNSIGYSIQEIDLKPMTSIKIDSPISGPIVGLNVKERDREGYTDQNAMSDGMFRALSILIHFNYYNLANLSGTVLIDDIGEGLDFERSTKLIKLLINKANKSNIQLIMSSNDKFVMNNTSLDYWQVIYREGSVVKMFNKHNSEEIFKDFKFTGLNNFDFFTTDFFKTGLN